MNFVRKFIVPSLLDSFIMNFVRKYCIHQSILFYFLWIIRLHIWIEDDVL